MTDDFIVVIRTAGERSFDASLALLHAQVPRERVLVVDERPFERALRRTYEFGLQHGRKWTCTFDADVLCADGAVAALVAEAEGLPSRYIQVEGRVFDKFTGLFRQAGHRVYRTSLLQEAIRHLPEPATTIRPEHETLLRMSALGHPSRRVAHVVGLHDFEQYYRDVYRKAFVHARKHRSWVPFIVDRCLRHAESDRDFDVVLKGVFDGLMTSDAISIDTRRFDGRLSEEWMASVGLTEKDRLESVGPGFDQSKAAWRSLLASTAAPTFDAVDEPAEPLTVRQMLWRNYKRTIATKGVMRGTVSGVGSMLKRFGTVLETL